MVKTVIGGSVNISGPRTTEQDSPSYVPEGIVKRALFPLYTTAGSLLLHTAQSTDDQGLLVIPAYSLIKGAWIYVEDAFTSTTAATGIDVGLVKASDLTTEVDFNGLIAVGGVGAKANLTAGKWDAGDGALIGAGTGAYDAQLYAKWATGGASDTLTGTAVVVVEWIEKLTYLLGDKT